MNLTLQSNLSKEIFNACQKFESHLSKPQQRNFREMSKGMLISGSVFLNQIGNISANQNNDRKNTERLSKMLDKIDAEALHQVHIKHQMYKYKDEPMLIFGDGGDFQKPHAKTMEKICANCDGSNNHQTGRGYCTFATMAYGILSEQITPLSQHLWSTEEEGYQSDWYEHKKVFDPLKEIIQSSVYDRIIIEDRGGDDVKRFNYHLHELNCSFITRIKFNRNIIIVDEDNEQTGEVLSVKDLAKKLKSKATSQRIWKNKKTKETLKSTIAYQRVYLPELKDQYNKHIPLYATFVFTAGYDNPMVLLTDLETKDTKTAWKYFFYYQKRWEIEKFFRIEKQNFAAEKFLIRNLKKIKALAFILMFVISLIFKLKQKIKDFLGNFYLIFKSFCKQKQRSARHHLDILAFIREYLTGMHLDYSYRNLSIHISKHKCFFDQNQLKLFDWRKKW